jgi:hypothetical protein
VRPADLRLLRYARVARGYLAVAVGLGLAGAALLQGWDTRVGAGGAAMQVDEIIVLDRGRVAQRGTHRELAAADGPYRRLYRSCPR